jgi:hypothetical protein
MIRRESLNLRSRLSNCHSRPNIYSSWSGGGPPGLSHSFGPNLLSFTGTYGPQGSLAASQSPAFISIGSGRFSTSFCFEQSGACFPPVAAGNAAPVKPATFVPFLPRLSQNRSKNNRLKM